MDFHLYLLCNRYEALVASQLSPEEFGTYMAVGLFRQTVGEELFFEIDPEKVAGAFDLERARRDCVSHPDGSPRRSKYVSVYRALEHIPLDAFGDLHLVTRDGRTLPLKGKSNGHNDSNGANMYMELCPAGALIVSSLGPGGFIRLITDLSNPVSYPRVFLVDMLLDRDPNGGIASYLPYDHPAHIAQCLDEVAHRDKPTKMVDRRPRVSGFYRTIRRGFYLGDQEDVLFYPYPSKDELDEHHHQWWRSASLG